MEPATAKDYRDRMDALMQKVAPNDLLAWVDAMQIVSDAWMAGHQRGTDLAVQTIREVNAELRAGK